MNNSLYVHIPFCQKKCFYCSFVVSIGQEHRIDSYLDCLQKEAEFYLDQELRTVYFGGGTPSLLNSDQLTKLFGLIRRQFRVTSNCEWTIEINPEGLNQAKAKLLYDLGVNRVSLGVQSLNAGYLKYLGRNHDIRGATDAFECLREVGFKNINVDLMYSFPNQTDAEIEADVAALTALGSEHLSLYALTIEENSRFYASKIKLSNDTEQARQYDLVVRCIEGAGFKQYEVSNFAKPGHESTHNLNYWQGGDYIGLGVSAHSHHQGTRSWNASPTNVYMEKVQQGLNPREGFEDLTLGQRFIELLVFGLRMNRGVNVEEISQRLGYQMNDSQKETIQQLIVDGFLFFQDDSHKVSAKGRLVLDEIAVRLI